MKHHLLPVSPANVQWGYFSKKANPALTLKSGDRSLFTFSGTIKRVKRKPRTDTSAVAT